MFGVCIRPCVVLRAIPVLGHRRRSLVLVSLPSFVPPHVASLARSLRSLSVARGYRLRLTVGKGGDRHTFEGLKRTVSFLLFRRHALVMSRRRCYVLVWRADLCINLCAYARRVWGVGSRIDPKSAQGIRRRSRCQGVECEGMELGQGGCSR